MRDVDEAWTAITEGPPALRAEALRTRLARTDDSTAVALACAERLAAADASLRQSSGGVLAVFVAARTPATEPLDPRLDGALGLVSRAFRLDERIYGRIPPERLAPILVRVLAERPDPTLGPLEIVTIATVRSAREVEALGAERAAQFLAAARAVVGKKKIASLTAAFASPLRDGEGPLVTRSATRALATTSGRSFADTGIVLELGTNTAAGIDWIDGSFEPTRPEMAALAYQLEAAPWRRGARGRR